MIHQSNHKVIMTQLCIIMLIFLGALNTLQATPEKTPDHIIWQSHENNLCIKSFSGTEAKPYLSEIAQLRITMFREFPYLYEGDIEYEKMYLETYFKSPNSNILLLFDREGAVVGFSNSIPLNEEMLEIQQPFLDQGIDPSTYLYIGEAMVKKEYQGMLIFHQMALHHKEVALKNGYEHVTFMTVFREDNHPEKPHDYKSLEPIWRHYGFEIMKNLTITMNWMRIDTHKVQRNFLIAWAQSTQQPQ